MGCQSKQPLMATTPALVTPYSANIAEQFVVAYNLHDPSAMLQWVHPEIRYMYISNDEIYTETNGKTALAKFLLPFFENKPQAQSKVLSSLHQGPFIQQVEQALWTDEKGQQKSQCSLSVYEIRDNLIINIWYFSVFKCP